MVILEKQFPFFFSRFLIEFLKLGAIEFISEISTQDLNYFLAMGVYDLYNFWQTKQ